jgi:predicted DNA-binding protein
MPNVFATDRTPPSTQVRMPAELRARLKGRADREGLSVGAVVRRACKAQLDLLDELDDLIATRQLERMGVR